jgi:hypothetical protein
MSPITGEGKQSCLSCVSFFCDTAHPFIFCISAASVSELLFKSLTQKSAGLQQQTLQIIWHLLCCEWGCAWFTLGRALPILYSTCFCFEIVLARDCTGMSAEIGVILQAFKQNLA